MRKTLFTFAAAGVGLAGAADAAEIDISTNIAVSTTWTANNTYNLTKQIYVLPGATLTIQAGTTIASDTGVGGSLAVAQGAQINVLGTKNKPVIMTSKADVATWAGSSFDGAGNIVSQGNRKTGAWREGVNEWGNLTIMGKGYISENATPGNVPTCNANNRATMEGLIVAPGQDPNTVLYGGGDDNDDSGTIRFLSLRYGGRVIGLNNELNGCSLGGIGSGTDISHVEIMNNVDDGFEIWGGCVGLKYVNVWNIGDDSFDIDQGWRGQAQFGLIVQGYSANASQGSGVGDNCFETDGAEDADWQPVTTTTIYNFTVVGQPVDGDRGTAWRDNARVQYRKCVFMDLGEELVGFDNIDGDGANGYGFNGTLSWPATWTTPWNAVPAHANDCPPGTYKAQADGFLAEISDSVFFRNLNANAYTEATARGVFDVSKNNVLIPGTSDLASPIQGIVRGPAVVKGGKTMLPVIGIDPRGQNEALQCVNPTPNNGFFMPVDYRGAFDGVDNWLCSWTATDAFGFLLNGGAPVVDGTGTNRSAGCVNVITTSDPSAQPVSLANDYQVICTSVQGFKNGLLFAGITGTATIPFNGGTLCTSPPLKRGPITNSQGTSPGACDGMLSSTVNNAVIPAGLDASAGCTGWYQWWYRDPQNGVGQLGSALSNAVELCFL